MINLESFTLRLNKQFCSVCYGNLWSATLKAVDNSCIEVTLRSEGKTFTENVALSSCLNPEDNSVDFPKLLREVFKSLYLSIDLRLGEFVELICSTPIVKAKVGDEPDEAVVAVKNRYDLKCLREGLKTLYEDVKKEYS